MELRSSVSVRSAQDGLLSDGFVTMELSFCKVRSAQDGLLRDGFVAMELSFCELRPDRLSQSEVSQSKATGNGSGDTVITVLHHGDADDGNDGDGC